MLTFINEQLAVEQIYVTIFTMALYAVIRGKALWTMDMEKLLQPMGVVFDVAINLLSAAYWIYCMFIDWKTTVVMAILLTVILSFFSFIVFRERAIHVLSNQE